MTLGVAMFFLISGFVLGALCVYGLDRAEGGPSPRPARRTRPPSRSTVPSSPRRGAPSSNVRLVPMWEREYATEYAVRVREHGQNFADGRE